MRTLEMAEAMAPLAEYAQDISEEPVILTKGKGEYNALEIKLMLEGEA